MFSLICEICSSEFESKRPETKTCSIECRKEYQKIYRRKYMSRRYKEDENFRKRVIKSVIKNTKKKKLENPEEWNKKRREQRKSWIERNPEKTKKYYGTEMKIKYSKKFTEEQQQLFEDLAKRQEDEPVIIKRKYCKICNSNKNVVIHHIKYSPVETISLCRSCHDILHRYYLNNRKCKN